MTKRRVVIVGASAAGRIVAYNLGYSSEVEVVGFLDADPAKWRTEIGGKPVLGPDSLLQDMPGKGVRHAVIAAGDPGIRRRLREQATAAGLELASAVHPTAIVSPGVRLAHGVVVLAGAILSDNPVIEENVWIGLGAAITHDTTIRRDSLIGGRSAIGAYVEVGPEAMVGWGAVVALSCRIGARAAVGSGANVVTDIPEDAVAVGNPAKVIKVRG
jgi:sugar O-acyltransferase (sialic acid O-acetyltransferase NeuD family)